MRRRNREAIVTLLTDFGLSDSYVGQMKGVILGAAPRCSIVDLSHEVPPQEVGAAARLIADAWPAFPPGTIHVCVVDPGVGSDRRALGIECRAGLFLAPDNGLLSSVMREYSDAAVRSLVHPLLHREPMSSTFHGRDLFALAAGRLAAGFPFERVGPLVDDPVILSETAPELKEDGTQRVVRGQIVGFDHFGNAATSIRVSDLRSPVVDIQARGQSWGPLRRYYGEVAVGERIALTSSAGRLELAVNGGSARLEGLTMGESVEIMMEKSPQCE